MNWHDRHAALETPDHRIDSRKHEPRPRDLLPSQQHSLAALIATAEAICECGILDERNESLVRIRIAEALSAFGMCAANRDEREVV